MTIYYIKQVLKEDDRKNLTKDLINYYKNKKK